ncbi:hypothetical protein D3C83_324260 [compost metagenome]
MSTSRFFDSKNRRVSSGNSVDTRVPGFRSLTDSTAESPGTATTMLTGRAVALE